MAAASLTICNDVIAKLNTQFSSTFTSQLALSLNLSNYDLSTLTVLISPIEVETDRASRASRFKTFTVAISIVKHVQDIQAEFPALMELVENVDQFLADPANRALSIAQYQEGSQTIFDYGDAEEENNFIGLLAVKYKSMTTP